MYIIIVGAGAIGSHLIDTAVSEKKNQMVVIEIDKDRAGCISGKYDITVLNADATKEETLIEAGAERADALITTTKDDSRNLMITHIAQKLEIPQIISTVNQSEHSELFRSQGISVLEAPKKILANQLYGMIKHPKVKDVITLAQESETFSITVEKTSPLMDKPLSHIKKKIIPPTVLIVAIERDGERWVPQDSEIVIEKGDILTFFSLKQTKASLIEKITGEKSQ